MITKWYIVDNSDNLILNVDREELLVPRGISSSAFI